ncbi:ATP-binding response regulator [Methanocalculus taiwanensis]|nr:ATP-binding protein [Methanocalculus taiwanensis]
MTNLPLNILYVDGDFGFCESGRSFFEGREEINLTTVQNAEVALQILAKQRFEGIISEYRLPGMDGISFLQQLREGGERTPFIFFTAEGGEELLIDALNGGAALFIRKGKNPESGFAALSIAILSVLTRREEQEEQKGKRTVQSSAPGSTIPAAFFQCLPDESRSLCAITPGIYSLSGYQAGDLISELHPGYNGLIHHEDRAAVFDTVQNAVSSGEPWICSYRILHRDGSIRWVQERGGAAIGDDGIISCLEGCIIDRTEEKRAEEAVHSAKRKLQSLLSTTRHDILNEIMALEGYLDFAEKLSVDPKQSGYLHEVKRRAAAIERQIELTRAFDRLGIEPPTWQELSAIINGINSHRLPIVQKCDRYRVLADPLIRNVFSHLMENTIRYAGEGSIITITCKEEDDHLVITWEDDGPGIPDDQKEKIFRRKIGKENSFGLHICREILAINGSTITETGTFQKGARFEIHLPHGTYQKSTGRKEPD